MPHKVNQTRIPEPQQLFDLPWQHFVYLKHVGIRKAVADGKRDLVQEQQLK